MEAIKNLLLGTYFMLFLLEKTGPMPVMKPEHNSISAYRPDIFLDI